MFLQKSSKIMNYAKFSLARTGTHSVRAEQRCDDKLIANGHRAEIYSNSYTEYIVKDLMGSERWYGFSIYLPEDFSLNYEDYGWHINLAQWHGTPDSKLGEISRSPPLTLWFNKNYVVNDWQINRRWDLKKDSTDSGTGKNYLLDPLDADELGKWSDWVFHVKWLVGDDGFFYKFGKMENLL